MSATRPPRRSDAGQRSGSTQAARDGRGEPRLPHEHDESSDSQVVGNDGAKKLMRQAAKDVENGLVDTDRGAVTEKLAREHFPAKATVAPKRR